MGFISSEDTGWILTVLKAELQCSSSVYTADYDLRYDQTGLSVFVLNTQEEWNVLSFQAETEPWRFGENKFTSNVFPRSRPNSLLYLLHFLHVQMRNLSEKQI